MQTRALCRIAQRASKQMTGYFGGYISKRQKMGQFELKKSAAALPSLKEKLQQRNLQTASSQLAHTINRMFVTLEGKGILQTCTQEFMLASQYKSHDPLSGECIRTFRHRHFHGRFYLDRFDAMMERSAPMTLSMLLPRSGGKQTLFDEVAFYALRDLRTPLRYLSP